MIRSSRFALGATLMAALFTAVVGACSTSSVACGNDGLKTGTCQAGPACSSGSAQIVLSDPSRTCSVNGGPGGESSICCAAATDSGADASGPRGSSTPDATSGTDGTTKSEAATDSGRDTTTTDVGHVDSGEPVDSGSMESSSQADGGVDAGRHSDGGSGDASSHADSGGGDASNPPDSAGGDAAGHSDAGGTCPAILVCTTLADCPASGTTCASDTCAAGCCGTVNTALGTPCNENGGVVCDGNGTCALRPVGQTCGAGAECVTGSCVSGFCCDTGCGGACQACSMALTGQANGTCGSVADGTQCNDGNACTQPESCQAGACVGPFCGSGLCGSSLTAFTGTQTAGWKLNGNATYDSATNTVVLVDGLSTVEAGTLIYQDLVTVDTFTVAFDFRVTATNGRADGIAFMIETDGPTALGAGYGGFGVLGLHGYGVELDIFDSGPCDPGEGNHAGVDLLSACTNPGIPSAIATSGDLYTPLGGADNGIGDIGDGQWRTATVTLANGQISVSVTDPTTQSASSPCPTCRTWRCRASSPAPRTTRFRRRLRLERARGGGRRSRNSERVIRQPSLPLRCRAGLPALQSHWLAPPMTPSPRRFPLQQVHVGLRAGVPAPDALATSRSSGPANLIRSSRRRRRCLAPLQHCDASVAAHAVRGALGSEGPLPHTSPPPKPDADAQTLLQHSVGWVQACPADTGALAAIDTRLAVAL